MSRSRSKRLIPFLLPYLLGALLLIALPSGLSFFIAFQRYNGIAKHDFIGWENFQFLLTEPLVKMGLLNSLIFIAWAVPLRILGALALALFYNRPRAGTGSYRAAAYMPTIIPVAAYALTWIWILNPIYGPLNASLRALGWFTPPWLADSTWALPSLIIMSLFQIGEGFVILLVGLRHIPREVYDAARVDGANRWQTFASITFPLLTPWSVLLSGATEVVACCSHAVLSGPAIDRIDASKLKEIIVTDTITLHERARQCKKKITVLPVAGLLSEAVRRIYYNDSVSSLFI